MININLLPPEYQVKKIKRIEISKIEFLPMIVRIISGIVVIQVLLSIVILYQKTTLKGINGKLKDIAPKRTEIEQLKKQIQDANKKITTVEQLTQKRFLWAKKLEQLSDSVIPGIWLESFSIEEKAKQTQTPTPAKTAGAHPVLQKQVNYVLALKGHAIGISNDDETAIIGKFMKSLKENKDFFADFEDIELGSIQKRKIKDVDIADFTLSCFFNEHATYGKE